MADIPHPWRAYAALQSKLGRRTAVDAQCWGMEEGLNRLLGGDAQLAEAAHLDRIVASAARRDRYGRSLLAKNLVTGTEVRDDMGQIEARSGLAILQRRMQPEKLDLLVEMASGADPAHAAARRGVVIGALRTRIARARHIARLMAA